jgi:hypothetical protein
MDLLEFIKEKSNSQEEYEQLVESLPKDPTKELKSKEEALAFMQTNDIFKRALDFHTTKKIEKHDEIKQEEFKKMAYEQAYKELNPELTEEQKRIQELERRLQDKEKKDAIEAEKARLRNLAKEIDFDPIRAEKYHVFGEEAESILRQDKEYITESVNTKLENEIKNRFGNGQPKKAEQQPGRTIKKSEWDQLGFQEKQALMADKANRPEIITD